MEKTTDLRYSFSCYRSQTDNAELRLFDSLEVDGENKIITEIHHRWAGKIYQNTVELRSELPPAKKMEVPQTLVEAEVVAFDASTGRYVFVF